MMTQLNFNLDMDQLKEEVMNSGLNAVMKSTIILILNEYMEKERDDYLQAQNYERTENRRDHRNGYYGRDLILSHGKIKLNVPRTRNGEFSTTVFEKYQRAEQSLILSMLEMVVNGVSTRKVSNIVKELAGEKVSKSFVSNLTQKLDPKVNEWANRPLNVTYFKYIYADAMYIKVREHHKIVSKAVYIAIGVNEKNKREIIGLKVDHSESKDAWNRFFENLKSRGLQSPKLLISDAHKGLKNAITESFIGTSWQRCTFHFKHNIINQMPKKHSKEAIELLKSIFDQPNYELAKERKDYFINQFQEKPGFQKPIETLDDGFDDAVQFLNEPSSYAIQLRTTNNLERLNEEIRRRERVIRIFPNNQSAFRLIGAVLMDYEETIDTGNRTFLKGN